QQGTIDMRHSTWTFALVVLCSTFAIAQQRGQAPPGVPAPPASPANPAAAAPAGQRGGGRGRGGVQVVALTSSPWRGGGEIPAPYTQAGEDMSPPLQWSSAPEGVVSYVLVAHDVDAAAGNGTEDLLHWLVWNIPAAVTSLHEHSPSMSQLPDGTRQISATG